MVLLGSQGDFFGRAVFAQHLAGDVVVLAFHLVGQRFAEIVDQGGVFGGLDVGTELFGNHAGDVRHLGGVFEYVLAVAGAVFQLTQQVQNFFWNADDADFAGSVFAGRMTSFSTFFCAFATTSSMRPG